MTTYSQDHKFSKVVSEAFRDIGNYEFVNPISSQPWGGRNRVIGRIRVFEKYLEGEDVIQARWLQMQAVAANPDDWRARDVGIEYLNKLMHERSNGTFWQEMEDIAKGLPSVIEYAEQACLPPPGVLRAMRHSHAIERRNKFEVVTSAPAKPA